MALDLWNKILSISVLGKNQLVLGGGVACNSRLQEMALSMCEQRGASCFILPNEFNVDNAAMIAWTGILRFNSGEETSVVDANIYPYLRTDEINISWRNFWRILRKIAPMILFNQYIVIVWQTATLFIRLVEK